MQTIKLSLGNVLKVSWDFYKKNFKDLFLIILMVSAAVVVLAQIFPFSISIKGEEPMSVGYVLAEIIVWLGIITTTSLVVRRLSDEAQTVSGALKEMGRRFLPLFGTMILMGIIIGGPIVIIILLPLAVGGVSALWAVVFALMILGLFILQIYWSFVMQIVITRNKWWWAALKESWRLIKGGWWKTLGYILFFLLISIVPLILTSIIYGLGLGIFGLAVSVLLYELIIVWWITALGAMFLAYEQSKPIQVSAVPTTEETPM